MFVKLRPYFSYLGRLPAKCAEALERSPRRTPCRGDLPSRLELHKQPPGIACGVGPLRSAVKRGRDADPATRPRRGASVQASSFMKLRMRAKRVFSCATQAACIAALCSSATRFTSLAASA